MAEAIVAEKVVKRYGDVVALDGFDLAVPEGTVTALLGPNGAGKTTAVRVLTTLLPPDGGHASVCGLDVRTAGAELRAMIGVSGQQVSVDEDLTGFENLDMIGRLYHLGRRRSRDRAFELIERFDLTDAANRVVKGYSGGMRRRLDLAGALVAKPEVLFLDEPTTGLDVRIRIELWDMIAELVAAGSTLLLATQYLEEADRLADQIAVVDHGRVIAVGTADELKDRVGGERLEITVRLAAALPRAASAIAALSEGPVVVDEESRRLTVPVERADGLLLKALRLLDRGAVEVVDVGLRRPGLDDVFLALTGRSVEGRPDVGDEDEREPVVAVATSGHGGMAR